MIDLSTICLAVRGIWKGFVYYIAYGKQWKRLYLIPEDPKTAEQLIRRSIFASAVATWQGFTELEKDTWKKKANRSGTALPGYQFFLSWYLRHN